MNNSNRRLLAGATTGLILALALAGMLFFRLQESHKQADTARAGDLAGQSRLLDANVGSNMILSGLLAVESAKNGTNLEADQALRHYLDLAAVPIARVSYGVGSFITMNVAYSPDGKYVVSAGGSVVKVWEAQTGRIVSSMPGAYGDSVAFSPDGRYVEASGYSGLTVWEAASGHEVISRSIDQFGGNSTFSPDGRFIAWSGKNAIHVWDLGNNNEALQIEYEGPANSLMYSPDGRSILSSSNDGTARIWDTNSGNEIMKLDVNITVNKAIFSADGRYIATTDDNKDAEVWEVKTGHSIFTTYYDHKVVDIDISPDGRLIVFGSDDGMAQVWNVFYRSKESQMTHSSGIRSVRFSPDGKYVASAGWDGPARVWGALTGREITRFGDASILSIAFSPDGKYLATGGCERMIFYQNGQPSVCQAVARVWEISNGGQLADISQGMHGEIISLMFSPVNASYVLTGNYDGTARVWDIRSGREVIHITHGTKPEPVKAAFSPNGQYIITNNGGDKTVRVWDARSGDEIAAKTSADNILSMAFSPDSQYVASGSYDGVIIVWDAKSGQEVSRMAQDGYIKYVVFSSSGKYIASIDPGKTSQGSVLPEGGGLQTWEPITLPTPKPGIVRIWEAMSGREAAVITSPSPVDNMAFSPDGKYLVLSGHTDLFKNNFKEIVSIREMLSGREIASYTYPYGEGSMLFTSDGKYLITGGINDYGTIVVWDMPAAKEAATIFGGDNGDDFNGSLSLSPDDRYLVSGGQPTKVWDLQSDRRQLEVLDELTDNLTYITHSREVQSKTEISQFNYGTTGRVSFSPDGRYLVAVGYDVDHNSIYSDQKIFVLYWRIGDLAAEVCRRLPRNFTREEWAQYFPNEAYRATCPNLPLDPAPTP